MIELRRIRESDLEELFFMRNDPGVYKWCRQNAPLQWNNHVAWYNSLGKNPSISMFWFDRGVVGLTDIDYVNSRAEFSCYVDPDLQGRGLGRAALLALFKHGFEDLGLNSIWGESFDGNPALKLFESLGMKKDGIRRNFYYRGGRFIDAHLISITRDEFVALHQPKGPAED